jgi:hypothetical protein
VETVFVSMVKDKPASMKDHHMHYDKDSKTRYYWKSPKLPPWALPQEDSEEIDELKSRITELALAQGTPQRSIDLRLAELVTVSELSAALNKLGGNI